MRKLLVALSLFAFAQTAQAQVAPYTIADCSISSLSGSSQQVVAANQQRKYLMIYNSSASNSAYVNLAGGTAATSGASSIVLSPTQSVVLTGSNIATNKVTVIGTSSQPLSCFEGR